MQFTEAAIYVFSLVRRKPGSREELLVLPAVARQLNALTRFTKLNGVRIVRSFVDTATYRNSVFTNSPIFTQAVAFADDRRIPLLIADVAHLIGETGKSAFLAMTSLDAHGELIFDVSSGHYWREFDGAKRLPIVGAAKSQIRTPAKRIGNAAEIDRTASQRRGATANRTNADRRSAQLKPIVEAFEASLPDGQALSPSMLARHLNELELRSARGGKWSHNTAKRLLERVRSE